MEKVINKEEEILEIESTFDSIDITDIEKLKAETEDELKKTLNSLDATHTSNKLKKLVSQNKNRFCFDGFDLDLSYITSRIIAMGLPSTSISSLFRNNMEDVKKFFQTRHPDHYCVYNLCEEKNYASDIFYKQEYYPFKDHEAPPLNIILPFCKNAKDFLDKDPNNVVAIHCLAGKGRTGTMISCLLQYLGIFDSAVKALKYYGIMRVDKGRGVTVPSQFRYVYYFEHLLKHKIPFPIDPPKYVLKKLRMITVPNFTHLGNGCTPVFTIQNGENLYKSSKHDKKKNISEKEPFVWFSIDESFVMKGDVRFEFSHKPPIGKKEKMFKFWINTYFLPPFETEGKQILQKSLIDKACKDITCKKFSKDFKVEIYYNYK